MTKIPIACTLTSEDDVASRVRDWQQALAQATGREPIDGGLRIRFGIDAALTANQARLAALEVECCGWLAFSLGVTAGGTILDVRAPEEGMDVLLSLFGSLS